MSIDIANSIWKMECGYATICDINCVSNFVVDN